jgi:alkylation response protein AidB-like acyl-CoA dehydrogenase
MSLTPNEREELRATARTMLGRSCPPERVREVIDTEAGSDADLWEQIVELGWTAIHMDERHGGSGCGYGDLGVVIHELGRALTPSPFLASGVLATGALAAAHNESLSAPKLGALASGSSVGSVALASLDGDYELGHLTTTWRLGGGGIVLDGQSGFVLDADLADFLVVAARGADDAPAAVLVETTSTRLGHERIPMVDETRRAFAVNFDGVVVPSAQLLCDPGPDAARLLDRVLALGVVAAAGDATGVAETALEATAAYARERTQFGKAIGSFQAVKHHCANMAINVEACRSATNAALVELDDDPDGGRTTAGVVASFVGPACSEVCALAMRVHGGIGFTWEHMTHLLMKRAKLDAVLFGRPSWHRQRLADAVFPTLVTVPAQQEARRSS